MNNLLYTIGQRKAVIAKILLVSVPAIILVKELLDTINGIL